MAFQFVSLSGRESNGVTVSTFIYSIVWQRICDCKWHVSCVLRKKSRNISVLRVSKKNKVESLLKVSSDDSLYPFKITFNQTIPSVLSAVLKIPNSHAVSCGEPRRAWNEGGYGNSALKRPEDKP